MGQDAAPPANPAAPAATGKKWNVAERVPLSYVMPVANDEAPAVMPPAAAAPARVSAPSPHTVPEDYVPMTPQMPMIPGPMGSLVNDVIAAASAPPPPSWGDVLANTGTQFKASSAQTIAGMKARSIVDPARIKGPPPYGTPEWYEYVRNVEQAQEWGGDTKFMYHDTPQLTPAQTTQLAAEMAGRVRIAKINIDENPATAARFDVRSIPAMLVFTSGREVDRIIGVQPKAEIVRRLERVTT